MILTTLFRFLLRSYALSSFTRLLILGSVVIGTFVVCFLPVLTSWSSLLQVFHRMFPFARGLYEDKVSNVWCASSILIKWHLWFPRERMVQASLFCTASAFLPSCIHVFLHPSRRSFLYTLAGCAFSFYLFSFQVHEKTILLPLLPLSLMVGQHPLLFAWAGVIANFR
jgi:alpha-1,3-glucosyltransferase